jgi:predicted branched-subunit amino acid permease
VTGGSVAVINLRHVLYSASIAKYLTNKPLCWRVTLAYLLTDEAFAMSVQRFETHPKNAHWHLLGGGLTLWACWQISTIVGVVLGAQIPAELNLDFAIPLTFIAIIAPQLRKIPHLVAAVSAGLVAVFGQSLPHNSWIIVAAIVGIVVGGGLSQKRKVA